MDQFGSLDALQAELSGEPIQLLGVNLIGAEGGNPEMVAGRGIPWLQDTDAGLAWSLWGAEHFDLILLDEANTKARVINLLEFDLTDPANYEELKAMLRAMASD